MNEKNKNNNILHGNSARIDPKKSITPRFENYVINNYRDDRNSRSYHRLDDDADFAKREVDSNQL